MERLLVNKKYLIVIGAVLLLSLFLLILSFSLLGPPSSSEVQSPPITTYPTQRFSPDPSSGEFYDPYSEEYKKSQEQIQNEEKEIHDRNQKVGLFVDTLPMVGYNFTAAYDIDTNSVIVTIPTTKKTEGEKEFDDYLRTNGITDRAWLPNVTIRYSDIDPDVH